VPLSLVVAIGSTILTALFGALFMVSRYAYAGDKREAERRIVLLEQARDALREQLHADELATSKLQGDVNLVKNNHDQLAADVEEIKRTMVTRDLFDTAITSLKSLVQQVIQWQQRTPSTREMPRVTLPSDPPRR